MKLVISAAIFKWLGQEKSSSLYIGWFYPLYANLKLPYDPWIIQNDTIHVFICIYLSWRQGEIQDINDW